MTTPSKELLCAVLGEMVKDLKRVNETEIAYDPKFVYPRSPRINVFELQNRIKDWLWKEGFAIQVTYKAPMFDNESFCLIYERYSKHKNEDGEDLFIAVTNTCGVDETEAIFKAGQWRLENQ